MYHRLNYEKFDPKLSSKLVYLYTILFLIFIYLSEKSVIESVVDLLHDVVEKVPQVSLNTCKTEFK
jgi:hypothetical protein